MYTRATLGFLIIASVSLDVSAEQDRSDVNAREFRIQELRSEHLPERSWVLPSLTGEFVAVLTREHSLIYRLRDDECAGPYSYDKGLVLTPDVPYAKSRPRWVKGSGGEETLVLNPNEKHGIQLSGNTWVPKSIPDVDLEKSARNEEHVRCKKESAGAPCRLKPLIEAKERKEKPWEPLNYALDVKLELPHTTSNGQSDVDRKDEVEIEYLIDVHPKLDRLLAYIEDQSRVICANLDTGSARELQVVGHPGMHASYMTAQYSPDGNWILGCFNYGPDDHYSGGFLQLFTSEGVFVEEIASFPKGVSSPAGESFWLPNDWIVYTDRIMIHFLKWRYLP